MKQKNKPTTFTILSIVIIMLITSCASVPATNDTQVIDDTNIEDTDNRVFDDTHVLEALKKADTAREKAIKAKAPRGAADQYKEGELLYNEGKEFQKKSMYKEAVLSYENATILFDESVEIANINRQAALDAIAEADAAISQLELDADSVITEIEEDE